jgi:hypothetical protein
MDKVCHFISINKYVISSKCIYINQDRRDKNCHIAGLGSIASHIVKLLHRFLKNEVYDINIYGDIDTPIVFFKYGNKEGNIMESKNHMGKYVWVVALFEMTY